MAWIYLITNDINGKQYIGKTYHNNIQERWYEHLQDYTKQRYDTRPLYDAMNKYGPEHFHIEEIEYVSPEVDLEEREIYWIAQYDTYYNGYNATRGGDGKRIYDYDLIIKTYQEVQNMKEVSRQLGMCKDTVRTALQNNNIQIIHSGEITKRKDSLSVDQYDLNDNYIQSFSCLQDAAKAVIKDSFNFRGAATHIADVCKGKRKTAYKYKWKFKEK